ncbi:MAG: Ig-like domain-containing protein [Bacteroidales bacterium]|nr:Ig-like domain-containing protein [Bacteroidales bacterium]
MMKDLITIIIIFIFFLSVLELTGQDYKIIDHRCNDLHAIPDNWIDSAQANLHIMYYRASHGSQLTDGGMTAIRNYSGSYASKYDYGDSDSDGTLHLEEAVADLEHENAVWVSMTDNYLANNPECNVVMWAWCDIYEMDINQYLADMEALEAKYGPGGSENRPVPVTFVYMNGHSWPYNSSGRGQSVFESNQQIREYCHANNKWFFDFTDLESYNPDGTYFGDGNPDGTYSGENRLGWDCSYDIDESIRGNWGIEWMNANPASELTLMAADNYCNSCEHSDGEGGDDNSRLHCVLKGIAAWWLWARIAGWGTDEEIPVTAINVTSEGGETEVIYPSENLQLYAEVLPENATNKSVSWTIINGTGEATINSTGLVTPVSEGTITARATADDGSGIFGEISLSIVDETVLVTDITVISQDNETEISYPLKTLQLYAVVLPVDATNNSVLWTVINGTGEATINTSGLVTPVAEGTVTARASALDGSGIHGDIELTIIDETILISDINITSEGGETNVNLPLGSLQLYAEIIPDNATNNLVSWSVSDISGEAVISTAGLVTPVSEGTVIARATAQDASGVFDEITVTVIDQMILVSEINIISENGTAEISLPDETLQLTAEILPVTASNKTVTWSVIPGTGEATISEEGLVTPVSEGSVTILAESNDGTGITDTLDIYITGVEVLVSTINVSSEGDRDEISEPGGTLQLYAEILPEEASNKNITWYVANVNGSANINESGLVQAISNGLVYVQAFAQDESGVYGYMVLSISGQNPDGINIHEITNIDIRNGIIFLPSSLTDFSFKQVRFVDIRGRIMKIETLYKDQYKIDFNELPEGIYVIQFVADKNTEYIKIYKP